MRVLDDYLLGDIGAGQDATKPDKLALGGLIGGDPNLPVWDSETGIDFSALTERKTITYPVPFAQYTSAIGGPDNVLRLTGRPTRRSVPFWIMYVGADRNQAKWAGEKLRLILERHRPAITGYRCGVIACDVSDRVRRDDNVMRPDGSPLWYGIDQFSVPIFYTETGVTLP